MSSRGRQRCAGQRPDTIPKIEVFISAVLRSQPPVLLGNTPDTAATWQVPNSVICAALGHLPPGATATGTTNIPLGDNEHRIYADNRRTQLDKRVAKIVRFGRTRTDIGVDLNNLTNTNYATGYNNTYIYGTDNTPRPSGWHAGQHLQPPVRAAEFHCEFLRAAGYGLRATGRRRNSGGSRESRTRPFSFGEVLTQGQRDRSCSSVEPLSLG